MDVQHTGGSRIPHALQADHVVPDGDGDDTVCNPGGNPSFAEALRAPTSRRQFVQAGLGALAVGFFGPDATNAAETHELCDAPGAAAAAGPATNLFSFESVAVSKEDTVRVPPGYEWKVVYPWGHPLRSDGPAFKPDASNSAAEQELQAGMGHDGMQWFAHPDDATGTSSELGLLALNHEYTDQGLLFKEGFNPMQPPTVEQVKKSQAAHGISVVAVRRTNGVWSVVDSKWNRRITANTEMTLTGPAAGSAEVKTSADPTGLKVFGTMNNCASGKTPWGTYLTCEENFNGVFGTDAPMFHPSDHMNRYGLTKDGFKKSYQWWVHDPRFDLNKEPNEPNRFGYVVEIDPSDPVSIPRKHTGLGRFKHENAALTFAADRRVVVYMGDDERNEYIYKFVSKNKYDPANPATNRLLLTEGTLYVAQFGANQQGKWLALVHGTNGLTVANGFADQASISVRTRQAADRVGATMMDRPEWVAVDPKTQRVYVTLSNNNRRGQTPASSHTPAGPNVANDAKPPIDGANPRADNVYGHILQWDEAGGDAAAESFVWKHFALAGDPILNNSVTINGDPFGSPDGLTFDPRGILWIQTDISTSTLNQGAYQNLGNNMMLAADPNTRLVRRFLTGPRGCEITGLALTPDFRTMFVNIQHPGEPASDISDPQNPKKVSDWPDGPTGGRPRPATIAITRPDGRPIGT